MTTKLRIVWEGETPGLTEHRVSLAAFGEALLSLLRAARNIAAIQVATAAGSDVDATRATKTTYVDLQISNLREGSVDLELETVPMPVRGADPSLAVDPERVTREILESIRDESQGRRRNRWVNEYLDKLPKGLKRQRYALVRDGQEEQVFEFEQMTLAEAPAVLPHLEIVRGIIWGLDFAVSNKPAIRIAQLEGGVITVTATAEQVEKASLLREGDKAIAAMVAMGPKPRLIWIRQEGTDAPGLTAEARDAHVLRRWSELLRRLAQ
ncbi:MULTISPECIES: hypothetical protein [Corallococcus]|uniref:hypothetical protein n=1 Tax=Corallococcus TaxID=83461 RepID=UPI00117FC6A6|nr:MULTISPECIES: hypothetical protein [Corallococcus]NBD09791.1 hypothetical protein [Corallococcus silvisoli]TSC23982.1 hypothetical protein FOF48_27660 [Corallococcus sp. Z5C101001]